MNFFLNEQCKDALNIDDFINTIDLTPDQLNFAKNKGLSEGISKVFIDNINISSGSVPTFAYCKKKGHFLA